MLRPVSVCRRSSTCRFQVLDVWWCPIPISKTSFVWLERQHFLCWSWKTCINAKLIFLHSKHAQNFKSWTFVYVRLGWRPQLCPSMSRSVFSTCVTSFFLLTTICFLTGDKPRGPLPKRGYFFLDQKPRVCSCFGRCFPCCNDRGRRLVSRRFAHPFDYLLSV